TELALRSAFRRRLGLPVESTDAQSRLTTLPVTFLQRTLLRIVLAFAMVLSKLARLHDSTHLYRHG
ncbi:MAG: hypothetical protein ABSE16_01430, partial [Verrucomicrobiota bacterium]